MREKLDFLLASQHWPLERVRHYQLEKLQALVHHAYDNVPYYRRVFDRVGFLPGDLTSLEDLARLPVLTKADIQGAFAELSARGGTQGAELNSTGGSTGAPLNFYQDDRYIAWADAARIRAWRYMPGLSERELEAVLWGAVRDIGRGVSMKAAAREVLRDGTLSLNTFDLDIPSLRKYLRMFNLLRPELLRGYASSLYYVARYVEENGLRVHRPRAVVSSTEVLHRRMRDCIERVFGCRVFDSYGCRELSQIATECEEHDGLHVVSENQFVELDGNEIVVTNLNNHVMPFIRYKIGDLASGIDTTPCRCGRCTPRIMALTGRDNDNIELPGGKVINGEFFEFLFFGITSVIQYQVVFNRRSGRMLVKLHVREGGAEVEEKVRKAMLEKFAFADVDVQFGEEFDKTPTGKLRFVYSIDA